MGVWRLTVLHFLLNKAKTALKKKQFENTPQLEYDKTLHETRPALKLANSLETGQKHVISNG
jgi:hypothetical protein